MDDETHTITKEEFIRIIEICDQKLENNPDDIDELTRKAISLMGLNQHNKALIYFDRALKIDPEFQWALDNKCMSLFFTERYSESLKCFNRALKLNPDSNSLLNNKAFLLSSMGKYQKAVDIFDILEKNELKIPMLNEKSRCLLKLENYDKLLETVEKILEIEPDNLYGIVRKGFALTGLGRINESLKFYDKALELDDKCVHGGYLKDLHWPHWAISV